MARYCMMCGESVSYSAAEDVLCLGGKLLIEPFEGLGDEKLRLTLIHREKNEVTTFLLSKGEAEILTKYLDSHR